MRITEGFNYITLKHFDIKTLHLKSKLLKKTQFNNSITKKHILLIPKSKSKKHPVVFILAGFMSNGPSYFNLKKLNELNFPQMIDKNYIHIPKAIYVFVDALTTLGGSQFLNSKIVGSFEDHIIKELAPYITEKFCSDHNLWAIMGGSSGGYGALHLASKYQLFKHVGAISADSFFETCYLTNLYKAIPYIKKNGLTNTLNLLLKGKVKDINVIESLAMTACYSKKLDYPIDLNTGELKKDVWKVWKSLDPVNFLKQRHKVVKKLKSAFIECGDADEFNLQFGAHQIAKILKSFDVKLHYHQFEGGHFDISKRRLNFLIWLNKCL